MQMVKKRLAVFASGRGSNFRAILEQVHTGFIPAGVVLCITNNPNAGAIDIARGDDIPVKIIIPKNFPDATAYNDAILKEVLEAKVDYIILAGYLKLIGRQIIDAYPDRIINIHPALLPSFGGKGMYGHHVHEAVFASGARVSGVTVHLVNNEYDAGPIVLQTAVSIDDVRSPDEIADRVLAVEHKIYSEAVKLLVEERLQILGKRVFITGKDSCGKD
jgi:formyltetrahydrofolate-dependent phosphoribosylglycinamide formyltransferase